ncbi:hypothetical protein BST12_08255 [Mycobacterium angelicum]|uniref:Lipoprotein n=2 Tax=Mycobacterium angelicum TaxID=470074 RepID=A0A1W9ZZ83_MYCAN|nr:hypothetical protein BST12_08255 [Mycobacterium angelicum]
MVRAALVASVLVGCSHTSPAAHPVPEPPAVSVNPSLLDPGKYPISPLAPLGDAGSEQAGRLVEGRRMASFVVGPWQADAGLTVSSTEAGVVENYSQISRVVWAPIEGGAYNLPFVVGFTSERQTPGPEPQMSLRNAVLRFADPGAASAAAQGMSGRARDFPRVPSAVPILIEPERVISIPGHADAAGTLLTFQDGSQTVRELTTLTAHGSFVLAQVARCAAGPDCEASLTARTLDLQLPLIDTFQPTAPEQFAALPLDPTGLVARTVPLPADQATSTSAAAYPPPGALHLEDDPVKAGPALTAAGVDYVSVNLTTVYQARDPAGAQALSQALSDAAAATPAAQAAASVPGLPQSRCTRVPGASGLVPRYRCLGTAGRYAIKTSARQLDSAHQQMAAQYRILVG